MEPDITNLLEEKEIQIAILEHKLGTIQQFPDLMLSDKLTHLEQVHFATLGLYALKRDLQIYQKNYGPKDTTY